MENCRELSAEEQHRILFYSLPLHAKRKFHQDSEQTRENKEKRAEKLWDFSSTFTDPTQTIFLLCHCLSDINTWRISVFFNLNFIFKREIKAEYLNEHFNKLTKGTFWQDEA